MDPSRPELELRHLHALIDGPAAHLIYEGDAADPSWARRVLARHIGSLAG
ncbi:hypothetical protein [Spongiactinospora sp. 9N601]